MQFFIKLILIVIRLSKQYCCILYYYATYCVLHNRVFIIQDLKNICLQESTTVRSRIPILVNCKRFQYFDDIIKYSFLSVIKLDICF